jgi:hypothetical protein
MRIYKRRRIKKSFASGQFGDYYLGFIDFLKKLKKLRTQQRIILRAKILSNHSAQFVNIQRYKKKGVLAYAFAMDIKSYLNKRTVWARELQVSLRPA